MTEAGILKADCIIHANGPKFREEDEEGKLRKTVQSALARAEEKGVKRLAFPPIGTGLYQVPLDLCARVMVDTICQHLANGSTLEEVLIVAPDTAGVQPRSRRRSRKEPEMHEVSPALHTAEVVHWIALVVMAIVYTLRLRWLLSFNLGKDKSAPGQPGPVEQATRARATRSSTSPCRGRWRAPASQRVSSSTSAS